MMYAIIHQKSYYCDNNKNHITTISTTKIHMHTSKLFWQTLNKHIKFSKLDNLIIANSLKEFSVKVQICTQLCCCYFQSETLLKKKIQKNLSLYARASWNVRIGKQQLIIKFRPSLVLLYFQHYLSLVILYIEVEIVQGQIRVLRFLKCYKYKKL